MKKEPISHIQKKPAEVTQQAKKVTEKQKKRRACEGIGPNSGQFN